MEGREKALHAPLLLQCVNMTSMQKLLLIITINLYHSMYHW